MNKYIQRFTKDFRTGWVTACFIPVLLSLLQGCSGPNLHPWHRVKLTAEFNTGMSAEVRTFEDYLRLEDILFQELEDKIYSKTETGAAYAIARYSARSLADPQHRTPNWNRSFVLTADNPHGGVLLLHGMSDSPYSLRALGEALSNKGYMVVGLRLPGHGTVPSSLKYTRWQDMAAAVDLAMKHLSSRLEGKPIHMIGYSTGGPLALDFTLNAISGKAAPLPASLVLISPAIGVHPVAGLAGFKNLLGRLPGLGGMAWLSIEPEFDPYKYNSFATNAATQVHRLTRSVVNRMALRAGSGHIEQFPPTLVFKSQVDATVSTDAIVSRLLVYLAPENHELVVFDINQLAAKINLLQPQYRRRSSSLMNDANLPFTVTLVTNKNLESMDVIVRSKKPLSNEINESPLGLEWPQGYISLSHVALPFPPNDPLYGMFDPKNPEQIFLGLQQIQGERGLFVLSSDWLLRVRHNPFYGYLEERTVAWIDKASMSNSPD